MAQGLEGWICNQTWASGPLSSSKSLKSRVFYTINSESVNIYMLYIYSYIVIGQATIPPLSKGHNQNEYISVFFNNYKCWANEETT